MVLISPSKTSIPLELKILKYLQPRMQFSAAQKLHYNNLKKGYEGEQKFHDILDKNLSSDYLIINDLRLKNNQTEFQIDTLLIGNNKIYPLEVKNYEGDFYIRKESWYSISSGNEIRNPLHQLKRSELLLQNILQQTRFNFLIESYIIFINSEFYLYRAALDLPIIFPPQINRFIKELNSISFKQTAQHKGLATYLADQHISRSSYEQLPEYNYDSLKKGIICASCSLFLEPYNYKNFVCNRCGYEEDIQSAIKRSVIEYATLFPNRKITTNAIYEWCHTIKSKKTIRRILKKHLTPVGNGRRTYYTFKK